jgi:hypothetical protein
VSREELLAEAWELSERAAKLLREGGHEQAKRLADLAETLHDAGIYGLFDDDDDDGGAK